MFNFLLDLKLAFRRLRKSPGFTVAAILMQTLGEFSDRSRHSLGVRHAARLHLLGLLSGTKQKLTHGT